MNLSYSYDTRILPAEVENYKMFMTNIFGKAVAPIGWLYREKEKSSGTLPYNIIENDYQFVIEIALAGLVKEDLRIELDKNFLCISHDSTSNRENKKVEDEKKYIHRGISQKYFYYRFILANNVRVNRASITDGMLRIYLEFVPTTPAALIQIPIE